MKLTIPISTRTRFIRIGFCLNKMELFPVEWDEQNELKTRSKLKQQKKKMNENDENEILWAPVGNSVMNYRTTVDINEVLFDKMKQSLRESDIRWKFNFSLTNKPKETNANAKVIQEMNGKWPKWMRRKKEWMNDTQTIRCY